MSYTSPNYQNINRDMNNNLYKNPYQNYEFTPNSSGLKSKISRFFAPIAEPFIKSRATKASTPEAAGIYNGLFRKNPSIGLTGLESEFEDNEPEYLKNMPRFYKNAPYPFVKNNLTKRNIFPTQHNSLDQLRYLLWQDDLKRGITPESYKQMSLKNKSNMADGLSFNEESNTSMQHGNIPNYIWVFLTPHLRQKYANIPAAYWKIPQSKIMHELDNLNILPQKYQLPIQQLYNTYPELTTNKGQAIEDAELRYLLWQHNLKSGLKSQFDINSDGLITPQYNSLGIYNSPRSNPYKSPKITTYSGLRYSPY